MVVLEIQFLQILTSIWYWHHFILAIVSKRYF